MVKFGKDGDSWFSSKNPKIVVMSRKEFERYAAKTHRESSIVVSISSFNEDLVSEELIRYPGNNILTVYRAVFDDTDKSDTGINQKQAIEIAEFIKSYITVVDKVIVHCGAGQSRSAGVAAAIMKWAIGDDMKIFGNPKYTPNMRCFRFVLEALYIG